MRTEYYPLYTESIAIPVAESYADCMTLVKSDRFRLTGKKESTLTAIMQCIKPFSRSSVLFWLRLCQFRGWLFPIFRIIYKVVSRRAQIDIPPTTRIGYGFYIGHQQSIVVNDATIIGNNVNLSQFLNIGTSEGQPAMIGNKVFVGPMVAIVDGVKIASNTTIGAGAVVIKDIPADATAVGVPAKVINYSEPGRYIVNPYPCPDTI
jgi:serine O-acetyltransferase